MSAAVTQRVVYLDNHSSTPVDPRVLEVMLPYFADNPSNPSNPYHPLGRKANDAVERARHQVAEIISANDGEIIFTSGATESNNIAILGAAASHERSSPCRIITTAVEHKSVLAPCQQLSERGFRVTVLPVDRTGHVDIDALQQALKEPTLLVSVQIANNEVGTIQRISEISRIVHEAGAILHCDGAQAVGKIPVSVGEMGIDLLSFSAHKMYGPKGIGALYIRRAVKRALRPLQYGGGQERGIRPGTLNVPAIVGFGEACQLCHQEMHQDAVRLQVLRDRFEQILLDAMSDVRRNGDLVNRLPNNSSLTFSSVDADALLLNLPDIALSTSSACTSGSIEPSHVLQAIGLSREMAYRTLRVGFGRFNTLQEAEYAAQRITEVAQNLSINVC